MVSQYYENNGAMLISTSREALFVPYEDVEVLEKEERPSDFMNERLMLTIFPEAKTYVKRKIKELHEILDASIETKREIESACYRNCRSTEEYDLVSSILLDVYYEIPRKKIEDHITLYEKMIFASLPPSENKMHNLHKAKQRRVEEFLGKICGGMTSCPFHTDKTPSMKVYKSENRVHCFSCGFHGDVIDLVSKMENLSTRETINKLS